MDDDKLFAEVLDAEPVDTTYFAGRWHRDSVHPGGVWVETKVFLKWLTVPHTQNHKFLIISRARSGSTLLTRLLNSHPDIKCDGEMLHRRILSPVNHLQRLAEKHKVRVYGSKLLSYQMIQVQRFSNPRSFLGQLVDRGYTLIHLERETFFQALSMAVAQESNHYHSDKSGGARAGQITVEPESFLKRLLWSETMLRYERAALAPFHHLKVNYDTDLVSPESQQSTTDRLVKEFGLEPKKVESGLKKLLPSDPNSVLTNYEEVRSHLVATGNERFLK